MELDYFSLAMRWLHILAMATAVGGTIFVRLALLPSVEVLGPDQRQSFRQSVRSRWAMIIHLAIATLLVTGLLSYFSIRQRFIEVTPDHHAPKLFDILFGIKFLLALGFFFIASALVGHSKAFERIRDNARFWLSTSVVLAILIICISGVLRSTHIYPNPPTETKTADAKPPAP